MQNTLAGSLGHRRGLMVMATPDNSAWFAHGTGRDTGEAVNLFIFYLVIFMYGFRICLWTCVCSARSRLADRHRDRARLGPQMVRNLSKISDELVRATDG